MSRSSTKRWLAAPVAAAVLAVTCGAGSALADVTVERTMKTAGFGGFGAGDSTMVEKISGLRKRSVTSMKMSGFIGKMAGELGGDEITDIQKDVIWRLDHKKKTYTESKITPPPEQKGGPAEKGGRQEKAEKPNVRIVRNEVTVTGPDGKKTIGDYACDHYAIVWVVETENLDTKERSESTMTSDLWTTPENGDIRALTREEREFTQAWLKKIGWDMTEQEARKMGLSMVGALIGGDDESFKKGAKEVAAKMEKIKGFPIGTGIKWQLKSSGGTAAKQGGGSGGGESEGAPDLSKGLGGLMAALGKKVAKSGDSSGGAGDAGGANTVFDTYTEIQKISTASLPGGDFVPPPGYTKVQ
jgi:hypothetical protein